MPDWLPAVIAGALLLLFAAAMAWYQWTTWKAGPAKLAAEDGMREHAFRQLRRRLQVSLLLALIGVMLPLGDMLPVFRHSPRLFVIYWLSVLGLIIWIVLLALGDLASNVVYHRSAQSELHAERKSLEEEIRRYRTRSNGQDHP